MGNTQTSANCTVCNTNVTVQALHCPNCGTRTPFISDVKVRLGNCWHCNASQATNATECTRCGVEDPVKFIYHRFYWKPVCLGVMVGIASPLFGLFVVVIGSLCQSWYPVKELLRKAQPETLHSNKVNLIKSGERSRAPLSPNNPEWSEQPTNDTEELECKICFEHQRNCVLVPCGHLAFCEQCANQIMSATSPKCPYCSHSIEKFVRMFVP